MSVPTGLFVGLVTVDVVQRVDRLPGPDEKVVSTRADIAAGGPAAGAAVTFAALGGRARLLTALGGGPVAALAAEDLRSARVQVRDVAADDAGGPAVSAVTVLDATGERAVVSRNAEGVEAAAPADLAALVAESDVVLLDGHHPRLALAAARAAAGAGVPVVLDAGSWKPVLPDLLALTTAAVCSSAFRRPDGRGAGADLLAAGPALVAVTAGPDPVRWWTATGSGAVAVPAARARDTLGAGDAFHGAYAHALAAGAGPVPALERAAAVASLRVGSVGPRSWLADPRLARLAAGR